MKILHIITDTNIGGAGRLLVSILNNMDYEKFDVSVCVPEGSALLPLLQGTNAKIIETKHGKDKSFEPAAVRELEKIIRHECPDAVHTHASLSGRIAAYNCNIPVRIMTRHCAFANPRYKTTFPVKQISGAFSDSLTTTYIATANIAKEKLTEIGCSPDKIVVIPNGSRKMERIGDSAKQELKKKLGIHDDEFVVGIAARLEEYKGHKYIIEAARILKDEKICFLFIGTGSNENKLRSYINELEVGNHIIFTGFTEDVAPYYNIMDVSVNSSTESEATSLSILESMSIGVPCVVTDVGGNSDIVRDGTDGFVVPKCDSAALADALLKLYNDRDMIKRFGEKAEESFDSRYTEAIMTEKLEKIYTGGQL